MPSNKWLTLVVLFGFISGYYMQTHFVSDDDDDEATVMPTNPSNGIKDKDGYCIFEEK